jgi:hypothetical protein
MACGGIARARDARATVDDYLSTRGWSGVTWLSGWLRKSLAGGCDWFS